MNQKDRSNILLVDDNPNNLLALSAILDRPEYNLITATTGRSALSHLLHYEFAVVLLDVMMPEMDGFRVASSMRSLEKTKFVPIIFVTAVAKDLSDIFKGYSLGAVDYIQKPLQPEIVRAKVSVFVELFRQKLEIKRQAEVIRTSERAQLLEKERSARLRAEAAEHRYYDLINWVDHAVLWEFDALIHNFAFVSKRSLEILGYSPEEWTKNPSFFVDHIHPDDRKTFEDMLEAAIIRGKDGRCEHRFYRSDGETLWVHSGVNPRKDHQGNVTLLWGLTLDITGFKTSEVNQRFLAQASAVLTSSLDYVDIVNNISHLIVPTLADWCTVELITPEGLLERIVVAHSSPENSEWVQDIRKEHKLRRDKDSAILKVIETGQPALWHQVSDTQIGSVAHDEKHLQILLSAKIQSAMIIPLKTRERVIGSISFLSNTPHRRFTEKDVKFGQELAWHIALAIDNSLLYSETKKALEMRDEMLGIVSHDLKGPLTAIGMNAQMLMKGGKSDPYTVAERIYRSVERMNRLISDLLTLAKIKAGYISLEKKPCQAQELLHEALDVFSPVAGSKGISIIQKVSKNPIQLKCDHDRILQVLLNILGNAIKFTPENGQITLGLELSDHDVLFFVSDTGPGISKEDIPYIFDRYWQAKEGKKVRESTGLGLFIAKKMVEIHQGKIWVESTPGSGSTFYFALPIIEGKQVAPHDAA